MVLQVFECESTSGAVFVEAYKLSHVEQLTRGMSGLYSRGLRMIPIGEMTDVMKACTVLKEAPVEPHQWVRVNKGVFAGDLGLVETVIDCKNVLLRLIPRIPDYWVTEEKAASTNTHKVPQTFRGLNTLSKTSQLVKIR